MLPTASNLVPTGGNAPPQPPYESSLALGSSRHIIVWLVFLAFYIFRDILFYTKGLTLFYTNFIRYGMFTLRT